MAYVWPCIAWLLHCLPASSNLIYKSGDSVHELAQCRCYGLKLWVCGHQCMLLCLLGGVDLSAHACSDAQNTSMLLFMLCCFARSAALHALLVKTTIAPSRSVCLLCWVLSQVFECLAGAGACCFACFGVLGRSSGGSSAATAASPCPPHLHW